MWLKVLLTAAVAAAASDELHDCLPGGQACSEDQAEVQEAGASSARVELLQLDLRLKGAKGRGAIAAETVVQADAQPLAVEGLLERLEEDEKAIASLRQMVKTEHANLEVLLEERHRHVAKERLASNSGEPVNCQKYPMFCDKRTDCGAHPLSPAERDAISKRIATPDGHANLRSWCAAYPMYATSLQKCILEGDPMGYAREMYASQAKYNLLNADAIYCFVSGHCNNTDVTLETTPRDAEALCDKRFGHDVWSKVGLNDFVRVLQLASKYESHKAVPKELHANDWKSVLRLAQSNALVSAYTSCAMGNYHCDVFYCKANYCDNPVYRNKYGNLSWSY